MGKLYLVTSTLDELKKNTRRCNVCGNLVLKNYNESNPGKIYWCPKHNELFECETKESYIPGTEDEIQKLSKAILDNLLSE